MLTKDPTRFEPPEPPRKDDRDRDDLGDRLHRRSAEYKAVMRGGLVRFGKLAAEQAIPIAVGFVSLIIAVDAWLSARPMAWEKERALASMEISSQIVPMGPKGSNEAVITVKVSNVGELTFAILDLHVRMETTDKLAGVWKQNSLLATHGAALPIGLRPFQLRGGTDSSRAGFQFDGRQKSWHVVDPGRSVLITFVQPVHGSGHLAVFMDLYTQPMKMADVATAIKVDEVINGITRPTMPEWGVGEVSDLPIYPYSAGYIVVIPPT